MVSITVFVIVLVVVCAIEWLIIKLLSSQKLQKAETKCQMAELKSAEYSFKLEEHKQTLDKLNVDLKQQDLNARTIQEKSIQTISELQTRLTEQALKFKEQMELLTTAKDQMKLEFESLAQKIFEEKGTKFAEQNKENLTTILSPLKEQLRDFKTKVEEVYDKEGKERFTLTKQIEQMHKAYETLSQEANNLVRALKADTKTQGDWGEIILNRLLENSGLIEGIHYKTQAHFSADEEKAFRPDVIIELPGNRQIIVDSKVSIKAYEQYYNAASDAEREEALKAHIKSLKNHIRELAVKRYDFIKELTTLDFVFMFIPIEAAFMVALDFDRDIFTEAYNQHVLIVCPSTLLVTLQMINSLWRVEDQNRNANLIADQGARLFEKFVGFVENLTDIKKHLDRSLDAYQKAHSQLTEGKGNLISQATKLIKLGVKSKSKLPEKILLDAETEQLIPEISEAIDEPRLDEIEAFEKF
jgi:DNA recombination protein RmuC